MYIRFENFVNSEVIIYNKYKINIKFNLFNKKYK